MSATGLLASGSGGDGLNSTLKEVAKFKGLDEVTKEGGEYHGRSHWLPDLRVPDQAPVLDANAVISLENLADIDDTLIKR